MSLLLLKNQRDIYFYVKAMLNYDKYITVDVKI